MLNSDRGEFTKLLAASMDVYGRPITTAFVDIFFAALGPYDLQSAREALSRHVQDPDAGRFAPKPADLIRQIQRGQPDDGRPGRDEAWAIALSSADEDETVVMTDEIQLAMVACRPVLDAGDRVGARMAFMSAYDRFTEEARREAAPVNWLVSLGYNASRRDVAIETAVRLKRLPQEKAALYLGRDMGEKPTKDGQAIAGLITGKTVAPATEKVRSKLQELRESLEAGKKSAEQKSGAEVRQKADDHAEKLRRHEELVRKAMESGNEN